MRFTTISLIGTVLTYQVNSLPVLRQRNDGSAEEVLGKRGIGMQVVREIEPANVQATHGQNALGHAKLAGAHIIGVPASIVSIPLAAAGSAIASLATAPYHYYKRRGKLGSNHLVAGTIVKPVTGVAATGIIPAAHLYDAGKHGALAIKNGIQAGFGDKRSKNTIAQVQSRTSDGYKTTFEGPIKLSHDMVPYSSNGLNRDELHYW